MKGVDRPPGIVDRGADGGFNLSGFGVGLRFAGRAAHAGRAIGGNEPVRRRAAPAAPAAAFPRAASRNVAISRGRPD